MAFRIALSGVQAANQDLSVTAHNIANANTTGFKGSRANFGDLYPIDSQGLTASASGAGVSLTAVQQQFSQGSIEFTQNSLDLSISGSGFFTVADENGVYYTRNGAFKLDSEQFMVNDQGQRLQVFPPVTGGGFDTAQLADVQLDSSISPPRATTLAEKQLNLPPGEAVPAVGTFDATDADSYNFATSVTAFDSLGVAHTVTSYFVQTATPNSWDVYFTIDGTQQGAAQTLTFGNDGQITTPANGEMVIPTFTPSTGADDLDITMDFTGTTQFGGDFTVSSVLQDGVTTGRLIGVEITDEGIIQTRFTNGEVEQLGQVTLANFSNLNGLQPVGDTQWVETFDSGQPQRSTPGASGFGRLQSGSLETSNVDLTEQLVKMITAQRNFQANAQVLSVSDEVTQAALNIR